jgi:hypothetical protein
LSSGGSHDGISKYTQSFDFDLNHITRFQEDGWFPEGADSFRRSRSNNVSGFQGNARGNEFD